MAEQYDILGGKVHVYKRPNSSHWQCSSYFAGKNRRTSTKEDSLSKAKEIAEDWYLQLRGKLRNGEIKTEKTFREASDLYLREYDIITQGQRSKIYVEGQHSRSRVHLVPFFGSMGLSEITAGKVQEYRIHRHEESNAKRGKPTAHTGGREPEYDDRRRYNDGGCGRRSQAKDCQRDSNQDQSDAEVDAGRTHGSPGNDEPRKVDFGDEVRAIQQTVARCRD